MHSQFSTRLLPQLLPWVAPVGISLGYWLGLRRSFALGPELFVVCLILELLFGGRRLATDVSAARLSRDYLWLGVPLYAVLLATGLSAVLNNHTTPSAVLPTLHLVCVGTGMVGGIFAVPIAHELMHSNKRFERTLAQIQMIMLGYPHFCVEHVEGHHRNVGLECDPATARYGESLYTFLPRSSYGGLVNAWKIEIRRHALTIRNQVLVATAALLTFVVALAIFAGLRGVSFFLGQSIVAVFILETLNYIEHYGLSRGREAPVDHSLAWDSTFPLSNWLMLNVPRHSDHHVHSRRPYFALSLPDGSRRLPGGYFSMFVLALFPPLWRWIMDPLVMTVERE